MNGKFLPVVLLAVLLVFAGLSAPSSVAEPATTATYCEVGEFGSLQLSAAAGTRYQIFSLQADGSYAFTTCGQMMGENAAVSVAAPPSAPEGTVLFYVKFTSKVGEVLWVTVSDDHLWGWA